MYRVLLVDDEPIARMGLRSTFDWEGNGFQLIGEASNGRNALQWIDRNDVDILITDIAMPVMDGLELMRTVRDRYPWIKIVLLSCHSDFAFVREGVRMGASDYLLKPTLDAADLKEVLDKVKGQIAESRKINELYIRQELAGKRIELEKTFAKLLAGETVPAQWSADLPWLTAGYRSVVCMLDGASNLLSEDGAVFSEIMLEEAQESFYECIGEGVAFRACSDQLILIVPAAREAETSFVRRLESFHSVLKERGFSFTLGFSGTYNGTEALKQAVREGREAAKLRFYEGAGRIHSYQPGFCNAGKEETAGWRSALMEAVAGGRRDETLACLYSLSKHWTKEYRTPAEVKREAQDALSILHMCKADKAVPIERIESLRTMEAVEEVRELMRSVFDELWNPGKEGEDYGLNRRMVSRAIEYLKAHYTQNISLQDVADHVSISKNYFSELFKKNTGQNFIDYLIRLRLNRASELLRTTPLKVYEIAEMSGFNDVKYFSKMFKKVMKVSPADYREGRSG